MHRINYHCKVQFGTVAQNTGMAFGPGWLYKKLEVFCSNLVTCAHQECPLECLSYLFFVFLYSLGIKGHCQINCVDNDSDFPTGTEENSYKSSDFS